MHNGKIKEDTEIANTKKEERDFLLEIISAHLTIEKKHDDARKIIAMISDEDKQEELLAYLK